MEENRFDQRGFWPYALAAFLVGIVGGFSSVLGPAFVRDLGLDYNNTTWTALAQAMSTAACAPVLGRLGDKLGRKKTLLLGIGVFALGNVMTAVAPGLAFMLLARFVVGIGTAAIAPVVMAYIVTEFPPAMVAKGFSAYMLISSAAVIFGPTLGGLVIERWGWRAMMWLCAGISVAVGVACLASREEGRTIPGKSAHFDGAGAVLVPVFFSLVLCLPAFGQNFGWTSGVFLGALAGAAVSLVLLIRAEKRAEQPILPGGFMKRRAFLLSAAALFLTQGLMQANMTNTIVFVNYTRPENTMVSGYAISVMYLGMSLGAVILGPLADRWEPKRVLAGSLVLTGIGCGLMLAFSEAASTWMLMAALGILGFGLGGNGTILMKVALSGLPAEEAGAGTGTYGLFRDLAAPFGVAVFVPMFTNRITALTASGVEGPAAAVSAVRALAMAEIACVAAGIAVTALLPRIHGSGEQGE